MTTTADPARRFTTDMLMGFDEPVRRYFAHAISEGAALPHGVRMAMSGRIKVGLWLPFSAEQTVDGRSFTWRARVGRGPLTPLRVTDCYADAAGSTEGRLLGRVTRFHAHDVNTARSAAARAAIESVVFAPPSVLPGRGVAWRAETEDVIVAGFDLPPERPEVRVRIDGHGAIRTVSALRWGNAGEKTFRYIRFGGEIHAERRFGDLMRRASQGRHVQQEFDVAAPAVVSGSLQTVRLTIRDVVLKRADRSIKVLAAGGAQYVARIPIAVGVDLVAVDEGRVVGRDPDERTPLTPIGRLWPSDHAGVVSRLRP